MPNSSDSSDSVSIKFNSLSAQERRRLRRLVDPEKRKRTPVACESCKKRKQKCNGEAPCALCKAKGFECIYGKGKPDLRMVGMAKMSKRKKTRERVESTPSEEQEASTANETPSTVAATSPGVSATEVAAKTISASNPVANTSTGNSTELAAEKEVTVDAVSMKSGSASNGNGEFQVDSLGDGRDPRLLADPQGNLHYIGESCTLSLLSQIRTLFTQRIGTSQFTLDPERYYIVDGQRFTTRTVPLWLPSKSATLELLVWFQKCVQKNWYVLEIDRIRIWIDQIYERPAAAGTPEICLIQLVIALASVYYNTAEDMNDKTEAVSNEILSMNMQHYFESALGYLSYTVEDGDIWVVQAYLLVSLYYDIQGKRNACWIQLGVAIRYSQALGMGRKWIDLSFPLTVQTHRKRLFRTLYIQDRLKSVCLGRPTSFANQDLDDEEDFYITLDKNDFDPDESVQVEMAKLCRILGDVHLKVYRSKRIDSRVAQDLANKLKAWSVQYETKSNPGLPSSTSGLLNINPATTQHTQLLLNLTYLHGIILLTRPFLFYTCAKRNQSTISTPSEAQQTFEKLSSTCTQSALLSIRLLESTFYTNTQPLRSTLLVYFTFTSGVILLLKQFRARSMPSHAPNSSLNWSVAGCLRILDHYGSQDCVAKRYFTIVRDMKSALGDNQEWRDRIFPNLNLPVARSPQELSEINTMSQNTIQTTNTATNTTTTTTDDIISKSHHDMPPIDGTPADSLLAGIDLEFVDFEEGMMPDWVFTANGPVDLTLEGGVEGVGVNEAVVDELSPELDTIREFMMHSGKRD